MITPIQVHGNDLAATLAELKREGKYAWAMDIVGTAEYLLHINFEHVAKMENAMPKQTRTSMRDSGSTPDVLTNVVRHTIRAACLKDSRSSGDTLPDNNHFAGEDKRSVTTPMAMPVLRTDTGAPSAGEGQGGCLSARSDATGNSISIEARLDALRESLVSKGKLRPRREARKPYKD